MACTDGLRTAARPESLRSAFLPWETLLLLREYLNNPLLGGKISSCGVPFPIPAWVFALPRGDEWAIGQKDSLLNSFAIAMH